MPQPSRSVATRPSHLVHAPAHIAAWLPLLAALGLLAGLAAIYNITAVTISLAIDSSTERLTTHAGTVADLLLEHRVDVKPGDLVQPEPWTHLGDGDRVTVQRARPVRVRADGRVVALRSHGRSVLAVLQEAGVRLGPRDRVQVNGQDWPADQPAMPAGSASGELQSRAIRLAAGPTGGRGRALTVPRSNFSGLEQGRPLPEEPPLLPGAERQWLVDVFRAVPVTVVEEGIPFELELAGATVGEALAAAGIPLYAQDQIAPSSDAAIHGSMRIDILRATPFVIEEDGRRREARAWATTVGEGLARAGTRLAGRDYSVPAVDTPLTDNLLVQIVRVVEDILVREVSIPFTTITEPDQAMALDEQLVLRPGELGLKTQRIRITYENGEEVDRRIEEEIIQREPVPERVAYGTQIVWRTVDTPAGPRRYWRHMRVYATSYSASRAGTPTSAPWYGRTRLGLTMRRGIVAVDPRLIPLGTNLFVPVYGIGLAGDTGGGIRNYHIDLGFDDDNYESWHQYVELYLLEPLPPEDQIRWILP